MRSNGWRLRGRGLDWPQPAGTAVTTAQPRRPVVSVVMRMVYTSAPDELFIPARQRLMRRFDRWARRHRRPVDLIVVEALLDHRWVEGDGLLGRWQPEDLEEALLDWFSRKVSLPLGVTVPTIDQLLEETAEVVVATATGSPPETAAALMHAWCARNPAASAELRALAERTDDAEHRRLALAYA